MREKPSRAPDQSGTLDFNDWLRTRLKAKNITQRQLAQQSGVNHSTISRLVRGERVPSLGTASKLANALVAIGDTSSTDLFRATPPSGNPTAGVEYALRSDDLLSEPDVRQVMQYYLAMRVRRLGGRVTGGPQGSPD